MELLENISTNTKPKDSCYIVCRGNNSSIQTTFSPALQGKGYEIAVVGLSTYYSYPNITEKNNRVDILRIDKEGTSYCNGRGSIGYRLLRNQGYK